MSNLLKKQAVKKKVNFAKLKIIGDFRQKCLYNAERFVSRISVQALRRLSKGFFVENERLFASRN